MAAHIYQIQFFFFNMLETMSKSSGYGQFILEIWQCKKKKSCYALSTYKKCNVCSHINRNSSIVSIITIRTYSIARSLLVLRIEN